MRYLPFAFALFLGLSCYSQQATSIPQNLVESVEKESTVEKEQKAEKLVLNIPVYDGRKLIYDPKRKKNEQTTTKPQK